MNQARCEVCGDPITILEQDPRYRDKLKDQVYSPQDEIDRQMNMTPEEKEAKRQFILDLFKQNNIEVHERTVDGQPVPS